MPRFSYPGHKYTGPGTDLRYQEVPVNENDVISQDHDINYGNPQIATSDADRQFVNRQLATRTGAGLLSATVISAKRVVDSVYGTDGIFRAGMSKRYKFGERIQDPYGTAHARFTQGRRLAGETNTGIQADNQLLASIQEETVGGGKFKVKAAQPGDGVSASDRKRKQPTSTDPKPDQGAALNTNQDPAVKMKRFDSGIPESLGGDGGGDMDQGQMDMGTGGAADNMGGGGAGSLMIHQGTMPKDPVIRSSSRKTFNCYLDNNRTTGGTLTVKCGKLETFHKRDATGNAVITEAAAFFNGVYSSGWRDLGHLAVNMSLHEAAKQHLQYAASSVKFVALHVDVKIERQYTDELASGTNKPTITTSDQGVVEIYDDNDYGFFPNNIMRFQDIDTRYAHNDSGRVIDPSTREEGYLKMVDRDFCLPKQWTGRKWPDCDTTADNKTVVIDADYNFFHPYHTGCVQELKVGQTWSRSYKLDGTELGLIMFQNEGNFFTPQMAWAATVETALVKDQWTSRVNHEQFTHVPQVSYQTLTKNNFSTSATSHSNFPLGGVSYVNEGQNQSSTMAGHTGYTRKYYDNHMTPVTKSRGLGPILLRPKPIRKSDGTLVNGGFQMSVAYAVDYEYTLAVYGSGNIAGVRVPPERFHHDVSDMDIASSGAGVYNMSRGVNAP